MYCLPAFAQDQKTLDYLRQEEQRKKAEVMRQLDSAVYLMDNAQYTLADKKLKFVLENVKSVPSDLTYFFGKNSFYLKRYKQSIDWLNKYIQLKGTSGQYYTEATDILEKAEDGLLHERATEAKKAEEVLSKNYDIDCGPAGKVSCPVCKGDHVIIKKGTFGDEYKTALIAMNMACSAVMNIINSSGANFKKSIKPPSTGNSSSHYFLAFPLTSYFLSLPFNTDKELD
jgi:hypothetical protein